MENVYVTHPQTALEARDWKATMMPNDGASTGTASEENTQAKAGDASAGGAQVNGGKTGDVATSGTTSGIIPTLQ